MANPGKVDRAGARKAQQQKAARRGITLAAARAVVRDGYTATTMKSIAKEAGYTASSLYNYFASKEAIFEELRSDMVEHFLAAVEEEIPDGLDFPARLALLSHRIGQLAEELREAVVMYVVGGFDPAEERSRERVMRHGEFRAAYTRWFERNSSEEERCGHPASEVALLYFGLLRAFYEEVILASPIDDELLKRSRLRANRFFLAALSAPTLD